MNFSVKLKKLRLLSNLKQQELAEKLHVSQQAVAKWENGKSEPNIVMLQSIASLFNCSVNDLLYSEVDLDEESQLAVNEGHSLVISNFDEMCSVLDEKTKDRIHTVLYSIRRLQNNICIDIKEKQFIFACVAELIGRVEMFADNVQSVHNDNNLTDKYMHEHKNHFISAELEILNDIIKTLTPDTLETSKIKTVILPMYLNGASAGTGNWLSDDIPVEYMTVPQNDKTKSADYMLKVCGDSMQPRFFDGDILLIKETPSITEGEIGIFIVNGESFVKKTGRGELISLNPAYDNIKLNEDDDIRCAGKVLGTIDLY